MGLGFVLFFLGLVGAIFAAIGGFTFWSLATFFTRDVLAEKRKTAVRMAGLFPFACLVWGGAIFVFQAVVNVAVLERDPGLGDDWHCPLPNGYVVMLWDSGGGVIYDPKTQDGSGVASEKGAVSGVALAQLAGRYVAGKTSSPMDAYPVEGFFLLDTLTGKRTDFPDLEALGRASAQIGIELKLEPIEKLYASYRFTWFDAFAATLLLLPPMGAALLLVRRILRLRRDHGTATTHPVTHPD